jgi:hypothetical protein
MFGTQAIGPCHLTAEQPGSDLAGKEAASIMVTGMGSMGALSMITAGIANMIATAIAGMTTIITEVN